MAKASTKKILQIEPEIIEKQEVVDQLKVIALEDINALINNKKINIKTGEIFQLTLTEFSFLKSKVNLC